MPKSFHRTPGRHCCYSDSVNSEFSVFQFGRQCRFLQRLGVDLTSAHLAPCALHPLLIQSAAHSLGWARTSVATWLASTGYFCGGRATHGGRQGAAAVFGAIQHRPNHPRPPRGLLLSCMHRSTVVVAWRAQGVLSAADGPARRCSVETSEQAKSNQG